MIDQDREPSRSLIDQLIDFVLFRAAILRSWSRQFNEFRIALAVLAIIPIVIVLGGVGLLLDLDRDNRELEQILAPRLDAIALARIAAASRAAIAPSFSHPTLTDMAKRLGGALPPNAHIRLLSVNRDGRIEVQIDGNDPETIVAALRNDALLATVRMVDQAPADEGIRIILRSADR